jgi:anion-transporting  ArsA/GET3 family ATPase
MLRVPKVIVEVVPPGVLRRDAEAAWRMFTNPAETAVVVVTLPEELPVTETLELLDSVQHELELPLGLLAVNGVLGTLFTEPERAAMAGVDLLGATKTPAEGAVQAAARRAVQERLQAASLARLFAGTTLPRVVLPYLFEDAATPRAIEALSAHF